MLVRGSCCALLWSWPWPPAWEGLSKLRRPGLAQLTLLLEGGTAPHSPSPLPGGAATSTLALADPCCRLLPVAWVLRGYDLDRLTRHDLLERLARTRGVVLERLRAIRHAADSAAQAK